MRQSRLLFAAILFGCASLAQSQVITSPPATMTVQSVNANDSTVGVIVLSATPSNDSINFAQPQANPSSPVGGVDTTPIQTCFAGSSTTTQTASCPSGTTTTSGATTFTQTQTTTTTCPLGIYGASSTVTTAWTPAAAAECTH